MSTLPRVTDHAVLRYMERVQGLDVEAVRTHIGMLCRSAVNAGAASLKTEGVEFQFKDRVVITVTPKTRGPSATRQRFIRERVTA